MNTKNPAIAITTQLENLCFKYNVKVLFNPKYHCELNTIEGLWCSLKYYTRKHDNQNFNNMKNLLNKARDFGIAYMLKKKELIQFYGPTL